MSTTIALEVVTVAEPIQSGNGFGGSTTADWTRTALLSILGYGLLAAVAAFVVTFGYRALTVRKLPVGSAVLVGLGLPTGWLAYLAIDHGEVIADSPLVHYTSSLFLLGVMVAGTVATLGGRRLGDHLACGVYDVRKLETDGPVADLVRSAGLTVAVTLPESIHDAAGYPTVDESVKRNLAGRRLLFPNDLSVSELQSRLETRFESDFDVGYVRAELTGEGEIDSLDVGDSQAGLSHTLGPDRVAVAIAGDPPSRASTGDPIEVWTGGEDSSQFVTTGTLRASTGPVTTLLVDADDAEAFEPRGRHRLTTRPETPSDGHALVSAIRAGDETVTVRTVETGGPLESEFTGWLPGTVLAIERGDDVLSLPADKEPLEAGDRAHVFGSPAELEASPTDAASEAADETEPQPSQPASVEYSSH